MRKKLLLGMITILTLSLYGCEDSNTEMKTAVNTEIVTTNTENTTVSVDESTELVTENTEVQDIYENVDSTQITYEKLYYEILDSNYEIISAGPDSYEYVDGNSGIGEVIMNGDNNALNTIGYTLYDVNNDGVSELIIGAISEETDNRQYGQSIYSVYTYQDTPHLILEGWSRNRCYLLEDGTFYSEGSNGAMYSIFTNYELGKQDTVLTYKDFYFTYEKDETFEEIGFYHNTTGEWDKSLSEELLISEDEFWNISNEYSNKIMTLEFVPFSMYPYTDEHTDNKNAEESGVYIEWASTDQINNSQLAGFVADTTEPQVSVALSFREDITNLKILSLLYEEEDSEDNIVFSTTELYTYDNLSADSPFIISLTMYGTIPSYGISYVDSDGVTHYYAISESGMDGSAILVEFVPKQ